MQDRFKFRVWLKITNKMYNVHSLHIGTNKAIISSRYGNVSVYIDKNSILMQSTGLKDKNGKLIYEGDLLKPFEEEDERVEVVWDEEKARFGLMIQWTDPCYWNGLYEETKTGRDYYELDDYCVEDFEVIGNIYENPELLEVNERHTI